MKKKISKSKEQAIRSVAVATMVIGAGTLVSSDAFAMEAQGFSFLGNGAQVRSKLMNSHATNSGYGAHVTVLGDHAPGHDKSGEGKCGEGKCGESKDDKEHKAGKGSEGKCGEGKCGEGKCGEGGSEGKGEAAQESKSSEGKCGEGKCG